MKIGILGSRGVPNYHGGFEQFAEFFSVFLAEKGHDVYVYNSSIHPYQDSTFKGVKLIHCTDPEDKVGTAGQFIYDFNCIIDSRKRDFDVILQLGYTSSSIWNKLFPKKALIITNMDGLEWMRSKYSKKVQTFLRYAEKLAAKSSDFLVSDSIGIQNYIKEKYNLDSKYIAYGAELFSDPREEILDEYNVQSYNYNMLIARLEPENNIEVILDGIAQATIKKTFLVIGKHDNKFGAYLKNKFKDFEHIKFIGGVYNLNHLNNLRYYSNLYFHGHSVGGTNPSLLEAMASNALIIANKNEFNQSILKNNAYYFSKAEDVRQFTDELKKENNSEKIEQNRLSIEEEFNWNKINNSYLNYFNECLQKGN